MAVMDASVSLIVKAANGIDLRVWQLGEHREHGEDEACA